MRPSFIITLTGWLVLGVTSPSFPIAIETNFSNFSGAAEMAFTQAIIQWNVRLRDPAVIRLDASFAPLDNLLLAKTEVIRETRPYTEVRTALMSDRQSAADSTAVTSLPDGGSLKILLSNPNGNSTLIPLDESTSHPLQTSLSLPPANLKALGLRTDDGTTVDAKLVFNSSELFDFDRGDGISKGEFDFIGVATHEIGHALGFFSGVDTLDRISLPGGPPPPDGVARPTVDDVIARAGLSVLDLYRYSPSGLFFEDGTRSFSAGGQAAFDIDGRAEHIDGFFATGEFNGNGDMAGHWLDLSDISQPDQGVMVASLERGKPFEVTRLDILAMDVIGYDVPIFGGPEPSTLLLFTLGLVGLAAWRWKQVKAHAAQSPTV